MVLSNKKLKQKLRTAKAEPFTDTVSSGIDPNSSGGSSMKPESSLDIENLEQAVRQRPRLTKRAKRRKTLSLLGLDSARKNPKGENGVQSNGSEGTLVSKVENRESEDKSEEMKKKKRHREEAESEEKGLKEDGSIKEAKKSKKKKKKKTKKEKKDNIEQDNIDVDDGGVSTVTNGNNESNEVKNEDATKVYVGGIPYYSTEDDIRSFFEGCGTMTGVDCMKFPDSGKFRGIAIITFKTEAAAKRALALDGADMGGFYLKIKAYKATRTNKLSNFAPGMVKGYNRIYVGNLPWDVTEDEVRNFFSDSNVSSIRFGKDKETGEFRGYAHVDFSDNLSLIMALKLDQRILCGRPIKISCAVPKKDAKDHSTALPATEETTAEGTKGEGISNGGGLSSVSGKIRRRTCYECGEKGHISTDCPKKQTAVTNGNTS
ncbi:hypothetical protein K2173_020433 [Erythroxylum novogranatense]|uniref:Uncharacterized protein n=1 Tax=Erythroxylum novogranatense TaxID=1862640 RepID=A0AAV8TGJ2_9ROSI|nr:hypothetical protein K2173_020433 [Erythroxylum novogranatense]